MLYVKTISFELPYFDLLLNFGPLRTLNKIDNLYYGPSLTDFYIFDMIYIDVWYYNNKKPIF